MVAQSRPADGNSGARLDSWKEIAAHLKRGVRTVQRWETSEGLPVHRIPHARQGSVFAYVQELDAWWHERSGRLDAAEPEPVEPNALAPSATASRAFRPVPLGLIALAALGALAIGALRLATRSTPAAAAPVTIAVLPFENLSGNTNDDYLADGITEELTTGLARLDPAALRVIARASAARFKQGPKPAAETAQAFGVQYLVGGSVRLSEGRLRIAAQLIEVAGETHVWAETYDEPLRDLVRTEAEIAEAITRRLSVRLLDRPGVTRPAVRPDAHVAYLKGSFFWSKRSEDGLRRAIEFFEEAIALDPGYAKAHAGLSTAHARLATSADVLPARQARALAEASARKAIALDRDLAEGHAALANVLCQFDWDWRACDEELGRAIALDPAYASGRQWLGERLVQRGRFREGQEELKAARALDPVSATIQTSLGIAYMYEKRYGEALGCFEQAVEIEPGFLLAHRVKGLTLVRMGRPDEGIASLLHARSINPRSAHTIADLGYALALAGRREEALLLRAELFRLERDRPVSAYDFAVLAAGLGETSQALAELEKGFAEGATGMRWLGVEPIFDPLRCEPRFRSLLARIGLSG